jgi:hypothetical protein
MSLATELLFNGTKRRVAQKEKRQSTNGAPSNWADLNEMVYALIDKHEPNPQLDAALKADLRVMQLSGLIDEFSPCSTRRICKEASDVMAELLRVLPRTK